MSTKNASSHQSITIARTLALCDHQGWEWRETNQSRRSLRTEVIIKPYRETISAMLKSQKLHRIKSLMTLLRESRSRWKETMIAMRWWINLMLAPPAETTPKTIAWTTRCGLWTSSATRSRHSIANLFWRTMKDHWLVQRASQDCWPLKPRRKWRPRCKLRTWCSVIRGPTALRRCSRQSSSPRAIKL